MNLPLVPLDCFHHTTDCGEQNLLPLSEHFNLIWYLVVLVSCDGDKLGLGEHK